MIGARETADARRADASDALVEGKRRSPSDGKPALGGRRGLIALQRSAGNAAVSALMAARLKSPGEKANAEIDVALKEIRRDEPAVDLVEKGLTAAKAAGVPVDLEGTKPPASALAVTKSGFGPASVAPKGPVPPTKPVPAVSPLGKAAAKPTKVAAKAKPAAAGKAAAGKAAAAPAGPAPAAATGGATGGERVTGPTALAPDQLLQPPVPPAGTGPEDDPAFARVTGTVKGFAKDKRAHQTATAKAKEAQAAAVPP